MNKQEKESPFILEKQLSKITSLQEQLRIYDRLLMKNEFLHALRLYTALIIQTGDFIKLKDLIIDYRFLTNWEEEQRLMINSPG